MRTTPKKSETIEIRLAHDAKTAFMEQCRREQRTASDAVRAFIEQSIAPAAPVAKTRRAPHWRMAVATLVGLSLGLGVAAPSLARSADTTHAAFDRLDRNNDRIVSYAEFSAR